LPGQHPIRGKAKAVESHVAKQLPQSGLLGLNVSEGNGPLCRFSMLQLLYGLGFSGLVRLASSFRSSGVFDALGRQGGLGRNVSLGFLQSFRAELGQHPLVFLRGEGVQEVLEALRLRLSEIEERHAHATGACVHHACWKGQRGAPIGQGHPQLHDAA
jgi:hypothetical protein